MTKDAQGQEWLVVICRGHSNSTSSLDLVYRRPNVKHLSSALYDVETKPLGWQLIGSFMLPNYRPAEAPWFFNGPGTEAQTMRIALVDTGQNFPSEEFYRLKISVAGNGAVLAELSNLPTSVRTWKVNSLYGGEPTRETSCSHEQLSETFYGSIRYILLVDYLNTQEILATIEDTHNYSDIGQTEYHDSRPFFTGQGTISSHDRAEIKINNRPLILREYTRTDSWTVGTTESSIHAGTEIFVQLEYLDLRHNLAAYTRTTLETSSNYPSATIANYNREYIVQHHDNETVLMSQQWTDSYCCEDDVLPSKYGRQFDASPSDCAFYTGTGEGSYPFYFHTGGVVPYYFDSVRRYKRSFGVDIEGRVFISQEIPIYAEDYYIAPISISGHFNFLSSGNIGGLTGLPNDTSDYTPIGVK